MKYNLSYHYLICLLLVSIWGGVSCTRSRKISDANYVEYSKEREVLDVLTKGSVESIYLLDAVADTDVNVDDIGYKVIDSKSDVVYSVQKQLKDALLSEGSLIKYDESVVSYGVFMPDIAFTCRFNDELVKGYISLAGKEVVLCYGEDALSYDLAADDNRLLYLSQALFPSDEYLASLREKVECEGNEKN